jgi:hypothetical protein
VCVLLIDIDLWMRKENKDHFMVVVSASKVKCYHAITIKDFIDIESRIILKKLLHSIGVPGLCLLLSFGSDFSFLFFLIIFWETEKKEKLDLDISYSKKNGTSFKIVSV